MSITLPYGRKARSAAGLIALVAGTTLVLRVVLRLDDSGSVLGAVSYLSQFFTILTNTLVCLAMAWIALGKWVPARVLMALTIAIVGVGLVYHVALAHLLDLSGLALLADHGVHTIVPLLTFAWWLAFSRKAPLSAQSVVIWILWPCVYCVYILIRASGSGFYPYPFLNLTDLGSTALASNIALLCAAFVVIGLALTVLAKILRRS